MNAPPTLRPENIPRFPANLLGSLTSAMYAWQSGVIHEIHPSTKSAKYNIHTLDLVFAWMRFVTMKPNADSTDSTLPDKLIDLALGCALKSPSTISRVRN